MIRWTQGNNNNASTKPNKHTLITPDSLSRLTCTVQAIILWYLYTCQKGFCKIPQQKTVLHETYSRCDTDEQLKSFYNHCTAYYMTSGCLFIRPVVHFVWDLFIFKNLPCLCYMWNVLFIGFSTLPLFHKKRWVIKYSTLMETNLCRLLRGYFDCKWTPQPFSRGLTFFKTVWSVEGKTGSSKELRNVFNCCNVWQ